MLEEKKDFDLFSDTKTNISEVDQPKTELLNNKSNFSLLDEEHNQRQTNENTKKEELNFNLKSVINEFGGQKFENEEEAMKEKQELNTLSNEEPKKGINMFLEIKQPDLFNLGQEKTLIEKTKQIQEVQIEISQKSELDTEKEPKVQPETIKPFTFEGSIEFKFDEKKKTSPVFSDEEDESPTKEGQNVEESRTKPFEFGTNNTIDFKFEEKKKKKPIFSDEEDESPRGQEETNKGEENLKAKDFEKTERRLDQNQEQEKIIQNDLFQNFDKSENLLKDHQKIVKIKNEIPQSENQGFNFFTKTKEQVMEKKENVLPKKDEDFVNEFEKLDFESTEKNKKDEKIEKPQETGLRRDFKKGLDKFNQTRKKTSTELKDEEKEENFNFDSIPSTTVENKGKQNTEKVTKKDLSKFSEEETEVLPKLDQNKIPPQYTTKNKIPDKFKGLIQPYVAPKKDNVKQEEEAFNFDSISKESNSFTQPIPIKETKEDPFVKYGNQSTDSIFKEFGNQKEKMEFGLTNIKQKEKVSEVKEKVTKTNLSKFSEEEEETPKKTQPSNSLDGSNTLRSQYKDKLKIFNDSRKQKTISQVNEAKTSNEENEEFNFDSITPSKTVEKPIVEKVTKTNLSKFSEKEEDEPSKLPQKKMTQYTNMNQIPEKFKAKELNETFKKDTKEIEESEKDLEDQFDNVFKTIPENKPKIIDIKKKDLQSYKDEDIDFTKNRNISQTIQDHQKNETMKSNLLKGEDINDDEIESKMKEIEVPNFKKKNEIKERKIHIPKQCFVHGYWMPYEFKKKSKKEVMEYYFREKKEKEFIPIITKEVEEQERKKLKEYQHILDICKIDEKDRELFQNSEKFNQNFFKEIGEEIKLPTYDEVMKVIFFKFNF